MTRTEVIAWLERHNYAARLAYPHIFYKADSTATTRRFKLTDLGIRLESRLANGEWIRIRSAYYKNLSTSVEDKLCGLSRLGM